MKNKQKIELLKAWFQDVMKHSVAVKPAIDGSVTVRVR